MSQSSDPHFVKAVIAAIDQAFDRYAEDNKVIFKSSSERAAAHFGGMNDALREWGKSKRCMVPGCNAQSIAKSHAISKQMSLATVAENRHVLEPRFDQRSGVLGLASVGVADASTFPGFCSSHEQLFVEFENGKQMTSSKHYGLQLYRSACRELFRTRWILKRDTLMLKTYVERRDAGMRRMILEHLAKAGYTNVRELSGFKMSDPLVEHAQRMIGHVQDIVTRLETVLLPALENGVFGSDGSGVGAVAVSIDIELPVALCGSGQFHVDPKNPRPVMALLNVIPQPGSTLILMGAEAAQEPDLVAYLNQWSTHAIKLLGMIESWMIFGTDQWYLRPSVWSAVPSDRQRALCRLILNPRRHIGQECPLSVFDDLRTELLRLADLERADAGSPGHLEFFGPERDKLNPSPQPEDAMDLRELVGFG